MKTMFVCDVPFTGTDIIVISSKYNRDEITKIIINTVSEWHNIISHKNNLKFLIATKRDLFMRQVPELGCDHNLLGYVLKKLTDTCEDLSYTIKVREEL